MIYFITRKSLANRRLTTFLCIFSIALSVALYLGIERVKKGAEEGFINTISKTDLIVGAKGSPLQLLLYSVFNIGQPINNIRFESYQEFNHHEKVLWTIPISLGDAYQGHRVVGTNENFFNHYRFRGDHQLIMAEGRPFEKIFEVVIGHEVAKKHKIHLGDKLILSHGIQESSLYHHDNTPFIVVGILKATHTPIDHALYVTLEGLEAMHIGWESGAPDNLARDLSALKREDVKVGQITSFLLACKSRIQLLHMKREIDLFAKEPLMAAIPGVTLQELWKTLGQGQKVLSLVSLCVLLVGFLGIVISLYTSINERKREMAILRSLGAGPKKIMTLFLFESGLLTFLGCLFGLILLNLLMLLLAPSIEREFSLAMQFPLLTLNEFLFMMLTTLGGLIAGLIPAIKAYMTNLQEGLNPS